MNRFFTLVLAAGFSLMFALAPSPALAEIGLEAEEMVVEEIDIELIEPEVVVEEVVIEEEVIEEYVPTDEPDQGPSLKFVVLLPEQIDRQWFWFYYTDETQHIVQSAVERALIDAGFEVIDVSAMEATGTINDIMSKDSALRKASAIGADYAVMGTAIADKKSDGVAYGVTVIRASASITARIIRVADGRVMAVEESEAEEGGQALKGASRDALRKAGRDIARKLARAAQGIATP